MSNTDYTAIDAAIIERIKAGNIGFTTIMQGEVRRLAEELAKRSADPDAWRIADRRLQALRKKGQIAYLPVDGQRRWVLVKP